METLKEVETSGDDNREQPTESIVVASPIITSEALEKLIERNRDSAGMGI